MIGIYKITSPTNKVYIGQSTNIEKRFKDYRYGNCRLQKRIYNSIKKYGSENHVFEIMIECSCEELNKYERYYQDIYDVLGKNGLNCLLTKDGDKSGITSNCTKKNLSLAMTGKVKTSEHKEKISKSLKGRKKSEETKLKMRKPKKISDLITGKKLSKEQIEKRSASQKKIILNTQTGIFYFGVKEASYSVNINNFTLYGYLNNKNKKNKTYLIYV